MTKSKITPQSTSASGEARNILIRPMGWDYNWFGKSARGKVTSIQVGVIGTIFDTLGIFTIIFFGIMATLFQHSRYLGVGLFYITLLAITIQARTSKETNLPHYMQKDFVPVPGSIIDFGPLDRWWISMSGGLILGLAMVFAIHTFTGTFFGLEAINTTGVQTAVPTFGILKSSTLKAAIGFMSTVFFIPVAEEYLFSAFATPSLVDIAGVIPGMLGVALTWDAWHYGVYQSSPEVLVVLFVFRILAMVIVLYTKSVTGALLAHIIINTAAVFGI